MRTPPIDPAFFAANRNRLAALLEPRSLAVLHGNDRMPTSGDGVHPFRQQSDLFYLCGIDQEETVLLLFPQAREAGDREILFVRPADERLALWEGAPLAFEEARRRSGVATVRSVLEFEAAFRRLALEAERIYLNANEHPRAASEVETRDARFARRCLGRFPLHRYERLAPLLRRLRAVKSPIEIELIRQAAEITGAAFRRLLGFIRPGVWEFEIEAEIVHEFLRRRSRGPAFEPIVASGENACVLHYVHNDRCCRAGELVLLDFGAEYAHYAGDLSRTVPVSGRFSPRQRQVYEAVLRVQKAAIALMRPGTPWAAYHEEVRRLVEEELVGLGVISRAELRDQPAERPLYKTWFPHGISHGLGLDVHDAVDPEDPFQAGMVLTCEPGLYLREETIGVRIENDIWITPEGPVDLTAGIPREVEEIEALMAAGPGA
jgi:Xaa-Pro aminopeptidase